MVSKRRSESPYAFHLSLGRFPSVAFQTVQLFVRFDNIDPLVSLQGRSPSPASFLCRSLVWCPWLGTRRSRPSQAPQHSPIFRDASHSWCFVRVILCPSRQSYLPSRLIQCHFPQVCPILNGGMCIKLWIRIFTCARNTFCFALIMWLFAVDWAS